MGPRLKRAMGLAGLAITLALFGLGLSPPVWLIQAREAVFDGYQRVSPRPYDPTLPVHVIDIDEASLAELGQWPWPRSHLAVLTDRAFAAGAVVLGFDVLFAEPDRTSPDALRASWSRFAGQAVDLPPGFPDPDAEFVRALASGPVVLGLAGAASRAVPQPKAGIAHSGNPPDGLTRYDGALAPLPKFAAPVAGLGTLTQGLEPSASGITRSLPMVSDLGGALYPSLSAELLRVAQGAGALATQGAGQASGGTARSVAMKTGAARYPLDDAGRFRIHFSGSQAARVTSALDLLTQAPDLEALHDRLDGKIVIVGASAQALFDLRATPLAPVVPAVEFHAEVLEQILSGQFLQRPDWAKGLELVAALVTGLLATALCLWLAPLTGVAIWAAVMAGLALSGWAAFHMGGLLLDPLLPLLTGLGVFFPLTVLGLFARERARAVIRDRFSYFLPETVMEKVLADPETALTPKGEARDVTIIFVDMQGFTGLTEHMDPQDVVRLLNRYSDALSGALVASGATIDKFIGDAVMAFWNAPLRVANHRGAALKAVPTLFAAIDEANAALARQGLPNVSIRMGINTGPAYVGLIGSARRLNYSVIGDSVTVAARMESLTRDFGVAVLIGEGGFEALPEGYTAIALDRVRVKGRSGRLTVSTLLPDGPALDELRSLIVQIRRALQDGDREALDPLLRGLSGLSVPHVDTGRLAARYRAQAPARDPDHSA